MRSSALFSGRIWPPAYLGRDIGNVEIDVILTYLLQLFADKEIMNHVTFKGGTMLRKMVFGPRGRLSTDLDFTHCSDIDFLTTQVRMRHD
ncbi:nucleotidyl transferase AbiEii/AbiGii toxin family protein [Rhizobium sullae]|uniref:nucleotidyl transferase AbiEii/AbiGii toxin family protein n=1 Tax=Rhizobium sullae TaxID=50338 RepID=UPI0010436533